jgi:hypothetical protein
LFAFFFPSCGGVGGWCIGVLKQPVIFAFGGRLFCFTVYWERLYEVHCCALGKSLCVCLCVWVYLGSCWWSDASCQQTFFPFSSLFSFLFPRPFSSLVCHAASERGVCNAGFDRDCFSTFSRQIHIPPIVDMLSFSCPYSYSQYSNEHVLPSSCFEGAICDLRFCTIP